ncbi:MAG: ethanolamine utilization protein EutN [Rubripirellula sp.]|nr:ethanolamine utilization protein EutN [Rubripirellula sp.]
MQPARVLGSARATIKHHSLNGQKLIIINLLTVDGSPDGPPLIALDHLGSRPGDCVMVTSDGTYARELTGQATNPARWTVMGIVD